MIRRRLGWTLGFILVAGCGGERADHPVEVTIPAGATFDEVVDSLEAHRVVVRPRLFSLYARVRGADREVRAGRYRFEPDAGWGSLLDDLVAGRVLTERLMVPEGLTLEPIAERIAEFSGVSTDSVLAILTGEDAEERYEVPGPGLEGYLLPETYLFADGWAPERIVRTMVDAYRNYWTDPRQARLDSLGLTRREITTLASIVQAEARFEDEMTRIASVYHNRVREGWPLQADPTVLYALGGRRERLLFAAIDSVADHPYNTYTQPGLPPGPIGAPGVAALDASLWPVDEGYMYFVAMPDGRHVFSRSLAEHNRAVAAARRARDSTASEGGARP